MAQVQSQKMSQTQIMSLNLLAMSSAELRREIYEFAEKHPALEITRDSLESGVSSSRKFRPHPDFQTIHTTARRLLQAQWQAIIFRPPLKAMLTSAKPFLTIWNISLIP